MAIMLSKLYAALRAGNVDEEKAAAAAEEVAGFENRLAAIEAKLNLLTWMTGFVIVLVIAVLGKLLVVK
jgi:hypothetical protein